MQAPEGSEKQKLSADGRCQGLGHLVIVAHHTLGAGGRRNPATNLVCVFVCCKRKEEWKMAAWLPGEELLATFFLGLPSCRPV